MTKKANIDEAKRKQELLKAERRKKNCLQTLHPGLADIVQNALINRSELSMRMYPELAQEGQAITRATAVFFHKVVGDRKFESEELPKMHDILKMYVEDQIKGYTELKKKLDDINV
jgi:hypothetical protein